MKVSIVITSYLKSAKPYLDLLIDSIKNSDFPKEFYETIVVTPGWYSPEYEDVSVVHPSRIEYSNAHAINFGFSQANKETTHYLYLNDDIILTNTCLSKLYFASLNQAPKAQIMPMSNDQQQRYALPIALYSEKEILYPKGSMRIGEVLPDKALFLNAESIYKDGFLIHDTLCTYATLIPKAMYLEVGPFHDLYKKAGPDDYDWCLRAKEKGYLNLISLSALAWHFGGVSSSETLSQDDREENKLKFNTTWSEDDIRSRDFIGE